MKKIISILLVAAMLLCCVPLTVSADDVINITANEVVTIDNASTRFLGGKTYHITEGVTFTVPSGVSLVIPLSCSVIVDKGATLRVNGQIVIAGNTSVLTVYGTINCAPTQLVNANGGSVKVNITVPSFQESGILKAAEEDASQNRITKIDFYTGTAEDADEKSISDKGSLKNLTAEFSVDATSATEEHLIDFGKYLFVDVTILEPDASKPRFDKNLFIVYFNGGKMDYTASTKLRHTQIVKAGEISYSAWTNDEDFYNIYKIALPSGEGYEVISRYGETETAYVKHGDPFAFRVIVDDAYDMSMVSVSFYDGYGFWINNPDVNTGLELMSESGYYLVNHVYGDASVSVGGVISNKTVGIITQVLEAISNFFGIIEEIFKSLESTFADLFAKFGLGGGEVVDAG